MHTQQRKRGYRGGKSCVSAATRARESVENEIGTRKEENTQTKNQSPPRRMRREESMEERKRVNKEKDRNTQRQETELVTGGRGSSRGSNQVKKEGQRKMTEEIT